MILKIVLALTSLLEDLLALFFLTKNHDPVFLYWVFFLFPLVTGLASVLTQLSGTLIDDLVIDIASELLQMVIFMGFADWGGAACGTFIFLCGVQIGCIVAGWVMDCASDGPGKCECCHVVELSHFLRSFKTCCFTNYQLILIQIQLVIFTSLFAVYAPWNDGSVSFQVGLVSFLWAQGIFLHESVERKHPENTDEPRSAVECLVPFVIMFWSIFMIVFSALYLATARKLWLIEDMGDGLADNTTGGKNLKDMGYTAADLDTLFGGKPASTYISAKDAKPFADLNLTGTGYTFDEDAGPQSFDYVFSIFTIVYYVFQLILGALSLLCGFKSKKVAPRWSRSGYDSRGNRVFDGYSR